jgi:hypothetical protein
MEACNLFIKNFGENIDFFAVLAGIADQGRKPSSHQVLAKT